MQVIGKLIEALGLRELFLDNPDPLRYQEYARATMPANWHGDAQPAEQRKKGPGVVLVNEATNTFEFPLDMSDILKGALKPELTDRERKGLKELGYNPDNPNYTKAKKYFFDMEGNVKAKDVEAYSGIPKNTLKDVLSVFRNEAFLSPSP